MSATAAHYRLPASAALNGHNLFTSPTESEFSDSYKESTGGKDSVQEWDELRVGEWLRSINCGQYAELFRRNHINGENLMDMDPATLKEMGIKKIGDRVRIGAQAKVFRSSVYKRTSKRNINRVSCTCEQSVKDGTNDLVQHSLATLDSNTQYTPPSSGSPRPLHSAKANNSSRAEKRLSRQLNSGDLNYAQHIGGKSSSRPGSPLIDQENRAQRLARSHVPSPLESARKEQASSYFTQPPTSARYGPGTRGYASGDATDSKIRA